MCLAAVKEKVYEALFENMSTEIQQNEYTVGTRAQAFEKAKQEGLTVVVPEPNQLQLDIDDEASYQTYVGQLSILEKYIGVVANTATISKSGGVRRHITLTLPRDVTPFERVGLQAMLGSDRKRELLGFVRIMQGDEDPTVFFEKPAETKEDIPEEDISF